MIRVVMLGRTGNNLFQYAFGRVLSERYSVPLVLDASWFNAEGWRSVRCLERLGIRARIQRGWSIGSRLLRKVSGRHPWELLGKRVISEVGGDLGFHAEFLDAPADSVLMGYFQSPRYFDSLAPQLREELDLTHLQWNGKTRRQVDMLVSEESVAVHVRRTDFVGRAEFDICGLDYYREAIDRMRQRDPGVRFYLFSDDIRWCREHLLMDRVQVMGSDFSDDPLHDLYLMSSCRHHIIANSTYSWWAAWLGRKSGQRVISPSRWFGGGIKAPIQDRLIEGWETVTVE